MALTTKEIELVALLRQKVGDLPTRVVVLADVDTTIYIDGVESTAVVGDVGQITWNTSLQIWSDAELVNEIMDSLIILYKGEKTSLETLLLIEEKIIILATRIELTLQLAMDAVRYVRFKALSVEATPVSPSELVNQAKFLQQQFDKIIEEVDDETLGGVVQQAAFRVIDRHEDLTVPTEYSPPQKIPAFTLTEVVPTIEIFIPYTFIADYKSHFIKKTITGGSTNILVEFYTLKEQTYVDEDVLVATEYTYELFVQSLNGELTSVSQSITTAP